MLTHVKTFSSALLGQCVNRIFPPTCLHCQASVAEHGQLCLSCWQPITFISDPQCSCCGLPFEYPVSEETRCAECIQRSPPYAQARSACLYDDHSKDLIIGFKYYDKLYYGPLLAQWLYRTGKSFLDEADLIIPVPLHRLRTFTRRYNQSALLAKRLEKLSGVPARMNILLRVRNTIPQAGLTQSQRKKNLAGAFTIRQKYRNLIEGKHIVLVDDVMTTGTTLRSCSRVLMRAGAASVSVLTIARVL